MSVELPVLNGQLFQDEKPQENCGVVGLIDFNGNGSIHRGVAALSAINHRGSDMAGFATRNGGIHRSRGLGMVKDTFTEKRIESAQLEGPLTIGHTRYKTQGGNSLSFGQPSVVTYEDRTLAGAHNGNIKDVESMAKTLRERGIKVNKKFDSFMLIQLIASAEGDNWIEKVQNGLKGVQGSYSLTLLTDDGHLLAVRDPWGNRPLSAAEMDNGVVVASETKAFPLVRGRNRYEVKPGEILDFSADGMFKSELLEEAEQKTCVFENIYFAHETSVIEGQTVSKYRKKLGEVIAKEHKGEGDVVTAVPESSSVAAAAYAREADKPLERLILKANTIDRTFMAGEMGDRINGVEAKYVISPDIEGESVDVVDDSIVIGNTIRILAANIKQNYNVKDLNIISTAPPLLRDCNLGVNMRSSDGEFVALAEDGTRAPDELIAKKLGVDSVQYSTIDDLKRVATELGMDPNKFCYECFGGEGIKPAVLKPERPKIVPFAFEKAS